MPLLRRRWLFASMFHPERVAPRPGVAATRADSSKVWRFPAPNDTSACGVPPPGRKHLHHRVDGVRAVEALWGSPHDLDALHVEGAESRQA